MTPSSLTPCTLVTNIDKSFYNPFTVDISLDNTNTLITGAYNKHNNLEVDQSDLNWQILLKNSGRVNFLYSIHDVLKLRADISVPEIFQKINFW